MSRPLFIFFGNEKLATGIETPRPLIQQAAEEAGFELEQHVTGDLSELRSHKSKIAVLAAYGRIIPQDMLDEFPLGIINIHPSLLPLYRGTTPIEQALLDGVKKTGVSIMRLTAGMDEGPIYKQKSVSINDDETKQSLADRLHRLGADLLQDSLQAIYDGSLKSRSQPHPSRATYSRKISKSDGELDFTKSAIQLEREIRSYSGWPKSRTNIANIDVIITSAKATPLSGKIGTCEIINGQLVIFCGQQALSIKSLKPAGKAEMSAEAFLAGYSQKL